MNDIIYVLIPFIIFAWCVVTLRVYIYWKMLKKKTGFDYFIMFSYYFFGVILMPMKLPADFPDSQILTLSKRYDKVLILYYTIAFLLLSAVIITMAIELRGRAEITSTI